MGRFDEESLRTANQQVGYWRQEAKELREQLERARDEINRLRVAMLDSVTELEEARVDEMMVARLSDARYPT